MHKWIQQGGLTTVVLLITDKAHAPVERFVFDLQSLASAEEEAAGLAYQAIERSLSAFITKISLSHSSLRPLPQGCQFQLVVYSDGGLPPETSHMDAEPVWIEGDAGSGFDCGGRRHTPQAPNLFISEPVIVPMKTLHSGGLRLQLHVEVPEGHQA
eukprot:CAMPEP_0114239828 /NCGR_PEP_ID=MMETSP0058-20121206/8689_1 /TAXON_ID=36894 /ORGANISM="Pyramimonas parkeae, CCMP726" /LENGTH=155 /DNA_ID=CAMNT_0001352077 /DNA_START=355 /DNA_END=822 /DNA_ORIENTATION=-